MKSVAVKQKRHPFLGLGSVGDASTGGANSRELILPLGSEAIDIPPQCSKHTAPSVGIILYLFGSNECFTSVSCGMQQRSSLQKTLHERKSP